MNITRIGFFRSSRLEVFCKKGVLKNFAKFTGKHLCHSLFFHKVVGLRPTTLLKKRPWHRCFPVNFAKFSRTLFCRTPPVAASTFCNYEKLLKSQLYIKNNNGGGMKTLFCLFRKRPMISQTICGQVRKKTLRNVWQNA